jgi:hypothetical protein
MLNLEPVSLGGLRDSTATKSRILANPYLTIGCGGCFYRYKMEILSFVLTADVKDSIIEIPAGGSILTAQQIELIKKADSLITIDNIRARTPDGRNVKLPSIVIYIKKDELQENP